jgi:hypothetical protein
MTPMRTFKGLAGIAAVIASVSCGDVVRQGRSPVYLVINQLQASSGGATSGQLSGTLQSDVLGSRTSPAPCTSDSPCRTVFNDTAEVTLRLSPRDIGTATNPTTPSLNNEVTINRYHVVYRRADGRNTPGVDVPYGFDGAVTGTVPAGGTLTLGFEIVRHVAKEEPPLVQLITSSTIITTIADVSFYGTDQVGNEVSVTGSILVDFGNFGDH